MCCTMVNKGVFLQFVVLIAFVFTPGLSGLGKGTDKQLLSNESGWLACDGTETEACHCEQEEINCDNVIFEDESALRTANLDIANKSFRVEKATFRENSISSLRQNAILPGHQGTVRELDFSHNRIVHIESGTFTPFRALNKLFLSNNKLNRLNRDQFLGLNALHQLFLDNNKITSLQDGVFEHLTNLRRLVLDGNKIKFRKGMFEGLENLEELSMDNCDIKDLDPDVFETIPSLKKLSLRGNPFTDVPRAVNSLKRLKYLDLSNTNIAELHAEFLKDNHVLKQFYMSNMPYLYSVQDCAFCGFERLERVYMNNCTKLQEIHPNAFGWSTLTAGKVTALTHFYVENCNLRTLSEDVLPWDTVTELGVGGNPWNCTCEIAFMLEDEYFSYEYSNTLPRCATPPELQGHLLIQVAHVEACDSMASLDRSGRFAATLMVMLILVFCSIGTYLCIITKRLHILLQHVQNPKVSYTNLTNKEDERELEQDFQPRSEKA